MINHGWIHSHFVIHAFHNLCLTFPLQFHLSPSQVQSYPCASWPCIIVSCNCSPGLWQLGWIVWLFSSIRLTPALVFGLCYILLSVSARFNGIHNRLIKLWLFLQCLWQGCCRQHLRLSVIEIYLFFIFTRLLEFLLASKMVTRL